MKSIIFALLMAGQAQAITVNPASSVTADSAATALTIPYRDSNGDFAVATLNAATVAATSAVSVTTATVGAVTGRFRGAFTSTQLATLSATAGDFAINATTTQLVLSSATLATGALPGAWIAISTSPNYTKLPGY